MAPASARRARRSKKLPPRSDATFPHVNWKLVGSTFLAVFLAELGDKTQLATMSLAVGEKAKLAVFLGSALALVATSAIAVTAGEALARVISPVWLRRI